MPDTRKSLKAAFSPAFLSPSEVNEAADISVRSCSTSTILGFLFKGAVSVGVALMGDSWMNRVSDELETSSNSPQRSTLRFKPGDGDLFFPLNPSPQP